MLLHVFDYDYDYDYEHEHEHDARDTNPVGWGRRAAMDMSFRIAYPMPTR
jgi:hypothetical protein